MTMYPTNHENIARALALALIQNHPLPWRLNMQQGPVIRDADGGEVVGLDHVTADQVITFVNHLQYEFDPDTAESDDEILAQMEASYDRTVLPQTPHYRDGC
jgi:hypothetical protein